MIVTLEGCVVLVTGASRGIGAATARELARRGAHVVITARSEGGLAETDDAIREAGGAATLLPLDLAEAATIDAIGPSLHQRFGRLDGLVHCAGALGVLTPVAHFLPKDWEEALAVNVTASWRLVRSTAPLLLAAPAGRAAFLTSTAPPAAYWGQYGATQAALRHLVQCWAEETRTTRLRVNLADPGAVATRLRRQAFPGEDQSSLRQPAEVAPGIADLCAPTETRHGEVVRLNG
ncbi:MAG: SDR family NAD(P)-dependent oxidoreductase [Rhodospirillales bacterium]|nr:SDR family NAD(P)-dependent oxidoreductase [Rhodospirillales bacterium]MDE2573800.1 SDR family NAD(P)-dependent oxidoreductase [Rhodospirillales bacterium]